MLEYETFKKYIDSNDMIYIDTCSLGKKGIRKFYNNVKNILVCNGKKIIIKEQVFNEVKKCKIKNIKDAARADKYLEKFLLEDLAIVKKAKSYEIPHADHGIKVDFDKYYTKNKMILITNDHDLAMDVLSINNQKSVKSKFKIEAVKITEDGCLEPYNNDEEYNGNYDFIIKNNQKTNRNSSRKLKHKEKLEDILIDDDAYCFERTRGKVYSFERAISNIYR